VSEIAKFSERLRECREKFGLTQYKLGQLCGFSKNQISRYEMGTQEPTLSAFLKLSEILHVELDYLVGKDNQGSYDSQAAMNELNIYERELLDAFRRDGWSGVLHLGADRVRK
jgi:transcriptional regulator with XRE-family HTH domain